MALRAKKAEAASRLGDPPRPLALLGARWPALVAAVGAGLLHVALPKSLRAGPPWLVLTGVGVLLAATVLANQAQRDRLNQLFGIAVLILLTASLSWALVALVMALPARAETPQALLLSAVAIWVSNVLVFASWYWRLDAGGPNVRERRARHAQGAFLFPQQVLNPPPIWNPGFTDYLFLAFTTSTAFSPTDTPVLSRWAKVAVMVQSTISLLTLALLAARAINIL